MTWFDNLRKKIGDGLSFISELVLFGSTLDKSDVYILILLYNNNKVGKETYISEITKETGMDYKTAWNSVKKLEITGKDLFTKGLIETYAKDGKYRNIYVRITKTGIAVMEQGFRMNEDEKEFNKRLIEHIRRTHPELDKKNGENV